MHEGQEWARALSSMWLHPRSCSNWARGVGVADGGRCWIFFESWVPHASDKVGSESSSPSSDSSAQSQHGHCPACINNDLHMSARWRRFKKWGGDCSDPGQTGASWATVVVAAAHSTISLQSAWSCCVHFSNNHSIGNVARERERERDLASRVNKAMLTC